METPTVTPPASGAAPAPPSAPVVAPPSSGVTPPAGSPPATGGTGGSPTPPTVDWSTAPEHFRKAYDELRGKLEPWEGLTKDGMTVEQAKEYLGFTNGIVNEAFSVGQALGYTEQQIQAALQDDVFSTVNFLRSKKAEADAAASRTPGGKGTPNDLNKLVEQQLGPIKAHINEQQTNAANAKFDSEVGRLITETYKGEDLPPKFRNLLTQAVSESYKYDQTGLLDLKFKGQTSHIARHFNEMRGLIEEAFSEWSQWQTKKAAGPGGGGNPGSGTPPAGGSAPVAGLTLDDIIAGNDKALAALPSMRPRQG